jgi:hypothetical protein
MGKMIAKEYFKDEETFKKHIDFIKSEEKNLDFKNKTYEIQNWLDIIKILIPAIIDSIGPNLLDISIILILLSLI